MSRRTSVIAGGLAGVVVAATTGIRIGRNAFERRIDAEIDSVLGQGSVGARAPVSEEDLATLPEPVRRWLRWSGVVGRPIPSTVRLRQEGELRIGGRGWIPFTAQEYYSTASPAFVWKARITMASGVEVVGKDSYLDGRGALEMRLLGVVPVARDSGPAVDEADLLRFLNEIMWFPAGALIPEITWEPVDDGSARATMTHGAASGTATFFFDAQGRLTNMVADRYDRESAAVVPWSTPVGSYGEFDGVRLSTSGEAVYTRPSGDYSYIRLRVTDVEFDVSQRY
ncbi:MAG: hypothetical protein LC679_05330 [Intrasporangiaceae bacterium]|nr:hypothetical protein [Intrasporangiaceae bacterium]